jgi:hypothetical protein
LPETNNIEEMLKQTMEILAKQREEIAKQSEEIAKLKEVKKETIDKTIPVKNIDENQVLNPFELEASKRKVEEEMKQQVENEFNAKQIIKEFDKKYSGYLTKEDLIIVNSSNADDRHKSVEKFARIFKNENNLELVPSMLKDDVKKIISLNDTEKAKFDDIHKLDLILSTFSEIKDKMDLKQSRNIGFQKPVVETVSNSIWKKAIEKANVKKA